MRGVSEGIFAAVNDVLGGVVAVALPVVLVDESPSVGSTLKKLPAMGCPRITSLTKFVKLKLSRSIVELAAASVKFDGWLYRRTTNLWCRDYECENG